MSTKIKATVLRSPYNIDAVEKLHQTDRLNLVIMPCSNWHEGEYIHLCNIIAADKETVAFLASDVPSLSDYRPEDALIIKPHHPILTVYESARHFLRSLVELGITIDLDDTCKAELNRPVFVLAASGAHAVQVLTSGQASAAIYNADERRDIRDMLFSNRRLHSQFRTALHNLVLTEFVRAGFVGLSLNCSLEQVVNAAEDLGVQFGH